MDNYGIKPGYMSRETNAYYEDYTGNIIYQPDVYTAAVTLARRVGAKTIIDIGSGNGEKLVPYNGEFKFSFVDYGSNLELTRKNLGKIDNEFIHQDLEKGFPKFPEALLKNAVVICSDVIEHLVKPDTLIKSLVELSNQVPFVVISTPERLRTRGSADYGPPQNPAHVREWSLEELDTLLRAFGLKDFVIGVTRSNNYDQMRQTAVVLAGTCIKDLLNGSGDQTKISPVIGLKSGEQLVAPIQPLNVAALINDAKKKGYTKVEAQVIYVNPSNLYAWPEAVSNSQHHGLIGLLGEVRSFDIGRPGVKASTYPFRLTILSPKTDLNMLNNFVTNSARLIDTGHLADDYLLETLVGWGILEP